MNISSEEMASNAYLRDQALQAAQLGLEYGELYLRSQPTVIADAVFKDNGTTDNDFDIDNDGVSCRGGLCIPANFIQSTPPIEERWVRDPGSDVWSNSDQHIVVPTAFLTPFFDGSPPPPLPPRFIIEFMGHTQSVQNGEQIASRCDTLPQDGVISLAEGRSEYPFCLTDPRLFRITALGTAGVANNPVEVMLQSTYISL